MKVALTMALVIFTLSSFGQNDQKLEAMFSKEQINKLKLDSPDILDFWSYVLDEGIVLQPFPEGKEDNLSQIESISITADFNLLEYVDQIGAQSKYFVDTITGQLVILKSMPQLVAGFNEKKAKS